MKTTKTRAASMQLATREQLTAAVKLIFACKKEKKKKRERKLQVKTSLI